MSGSGTISPPITPNDAMQNPVGANYLLAHMLSWDGAHWVRYNPGAITVSITPAVAATLTTSQTAVGNTNPAAQVRAATATSKGFMIQNSGAKDMFVGFTNAVTAATGVKVPSGGGTWPNIPGVVYTGPVFAICAGADTTTADLTELTP